MEPPEKRNANSNDRPTLCQDGIGIKCESTLDAINPGQLPLVISSIPSHSGENLNHINGSGLHYQAGLTRHSQHNGWLLAQPPAAVGQWPLHNSRMHHRYHFQSAQGQTESQ